MMPPSFAKRQAKNQMINGILKQVAKKKINRRYPNSYRYISSIYAILGFIQTLLSVELMNGILGLCVSG